MPSLLEMKTYGLELELFLKDASGQYIIIPDGFPRDACGYLVEARGEEHRNSLEAVHLLRAAIDRVDMRAKKDNLKLELADTAPLSPEFLRTTRRRFGKNPGRSFFVGGGCYRNSNPRAGLHIHFGDTRIVKLADGTTQTYPNPQNIPRIIWLLDRAFKEEIRAAKRVPGEYEMKPYGFEYRSLPATILLTKVQTVLEELSTEYI